MMRLRTILPRSAAVLALCGLAGAQAPGPRTIAPPSGWTPGQAKAAPRPDATASSAEAYHPPATSSGPRSAALYVTRVEHRATPERRDAIASAEIEEIFAAQRRQGAGAKTEASARRADPAARQLEATLTWRDAGIGMIDSSRVVAAADPQRVVAVTGQCLFALDAPAELVKACEASLATLDPGIPAAARVQLSLSAEPAPPAPAGPAAPAAAPAPARSGSGGATGPAPPALDDAGRVGLSPPQPRPELQPRQQEPDRRPLYLGLGLVALALLFWWNRRRRERFEAEDRAAGGGGDEDDDELHDAAAKPAAAGEAAAAGEPAAAKAADPGERADRKEKDA